MVFKGTFQKRLLLHVLATKVLTLKTTDRHKKTALSSKQRSPLNILKLTML